MSSPGRTFREALLSDILQSVERLPASRSRTLLWFDPAGESDSLLALIRDDGRVELRNFQLDGDSQVDLKLGLLGQAAGHTPLILYLPLAEPKMLLAAADGMAPRLWSLAEYRFLASSWNGLGGSPDDPVPRTLAHWLEGAGARFVDRRSIEALSRGDGATRLARYAVRHANEPLDRWPVLSDKLVLDETTGNPRDRLIEYLTDPASAVASWGSDAAEVRERVGQEYGLRWADGRPADEVATTLALTEAWEAFRRPEDYPFAGRLPKGLQQRERVIRLVRQDLVRNVDLRNALVKSVASTQPEWLETLATAPLTAVALPMALPALADRLLRRAIAELTDSSPDDRGLAIDRLRSLLPSDPSVLGALRPVAEAARDVITLLAGVGSAVDTAGTSKSADALVSSYASTWYLLDGAYLRIRSQTAAEPSLARLREVADGTYFEYVRRVNDRFSEMVESSGAWPPAGTALSRKPAWGSRKGRSAVIVTDALRLDVAHQVAERIGTTATIQTGMSTLPTTTPFGMTALLPVDAPVTVDPAGDSLIVEGVDLSGKGGRQTFLRRQLEAAGKRVTFLEVAELLQGSSIGDAELVVLFDYELDNQGHGVGSLPAYVDGHVARLARAVSRLHELGVTTVELATDHGFLHHPPHLTDSLGTPPVAAVQKHGQDRRYAVLKPDAPMVGLIRLQSPIAPGLPLGFARGVRTLQKAKEYLHGGVSLQECVIPVIRSESKAPLPRLKPEVVVTSTTVSVGTIVAELRPVSPAGQLQLGGLAPIRVRLTLTTADGRDAAEESPEEELRLDTPPLRLALYLREGLGLRTGDTLTLVAEDARTGERYESIALTMGIDWE